MDVDVQGCGFRMQTKRVKRAAGVHVCWCAMCACINVSYDKMFSKYILFPFSSHQQNCIYQTNVTRMRFLGKWIV